MAQQKKYEPRTMSEKYVWHADRAFKNHKPAGSKMTKAEKAAYSAGYVKHARDTARAYKFNKAKSIGYSKQDAERIAKNPKLYFDENTCDFELRQKIK
ncbi:MAG: hypothetical protein IJZ27_01000 [Treponema sp.]|nr:hypothetical protein [Treponema sp.]